VPWALGGNGGGSGSDWGVPDSGPAGGGGAAPPPDARAALSALLNSPHPLDILADVSAYGPRGSVSRYHNPFSYTRALANEQRRRKGALRRGVERALGAAAAAATAAATAAGRWPAERLPQLQLPPQLALPPQLDGLARLWPVLWADTKQK
jgi:hypothetical protein